MSDEREPLDPWAATNGHTWTIDDACLTCGAPETPDPAPCPGEQPYASDYCPYGCGPDEPLDPGPGACPACGA